MEQTRESLKHYRPAVISRPSTFTKTRSAWPTVSAPPTLSSRASRHRRSHYGHQSAFLDQHYTDTSTAFDFRTYHLQRQFSEDSGFSSCGSSASSVADDLETFSGSTSYGTTTSHWPKQSYRWNSAASLEAFSGSSSYGTVTSHYSKQSYRWNSASSRNCRLQSSTVASVLAAGVSDSEETDYCESDDEVSDGVFSHLAITRNDLKESKLSSTETCIVSSVTQFLENLTEKKDSLQLKHCGRNILDLGTNVTSHFPLKPTELPEKNLPLYLQNRSQYHRLGKFGAVETLCFANCKKQCGFAFPVPPNESDFNCEKKSVI